MKTALLRGVSAALLIPSLAAAQTPDAAPIVSPPPVMMPAPAIPSLSDSQLDQLRKMLDGAAADGIAAAGETSAVPADAGQDAIVRAALDYAKALHHGRLAESDFMGNWGLRPAPYDPRPPSSRR